VTTGREWQHVLREKGYRLTPQRELVLAAVDDLGHATPDEVLTKVREQSMSVNMSTVYRTLELLEELGLVRHTHITDRAPTYHSTTTPAHVHLVCRGCGRVLEAAPEEFEPLAARLRATHDFEPDVGHLTVFGRCGGCSPSTSEETP
jgi:Fur family ferric uptake transcriptional regulator